MRAALSGSLADVSRRPKRALRRLRGGAGYVTEPFESAGEDAGSYYLRREV